MLAPFTPRLAVGRDCRTIPLGRLRRTFIALAAATVALSVFGDTAESTDLANLSLEQLSEIQITTVSRKEEPLRLAASAVTVVTREDIEHSGATIIPEALRNVPGLDVAQINAHDWAISARGSNSRFANRQLVLVDGRTIYSPFSGGVFWEIAGPPIEEVYRIEVVRGPGAIAWGANAVNGVINIVTQSARETQGGLLSVSGGAEGNWQGYFREGFQTGDHTWVRLYGQYNRADEAKYTNGTDAGDAWRGGHFGMRLDSELSESSQLMMQAEFSTVRSGEAGDYPLLTPPYRAVIPEATTQRDTHVQSRWTREFSPDSILTVQGFWSREDRTQYRDDFASDTFDLNWTHQFKATERQALVWGGGVREITHRLVGEVGVIFPDPSPTDEVYNGFIQDEFQVLPDQLSVTLGTKLEHNNVSGIEWEPGARLTWEPTVKQTLWAAVSRSVHTPAILQRDLLFDASVVPLGTIIRQISEGFNQPTNQLSYELGYRIQTSAHVNLDASVFYNVIEHSEAFQRGTPFAEDGHLVVPVRFNPFGVSGTSKGAELSATWQTTDTWQLSADCTFFEDFYDLMPNQITVFGRTPRYRFGLRSSIELPNHWEMNWAMRYVDARPGTDIVAYTTGDANFRWRPSPSWEFSIVGQNLFQKQHVEMIPPTLGDLVDVPRSIHARILFKF